MRRCRIRLAARDWARTLAYVDPVSPADDRMPLDASAALATVLPREAASMTATRALGSRLAALAAARDAAARTDALAACAAWLRGREGGLTLPEGRTFGPGESNPRLQRVALFIRALEASPVLREHVRSALRELVAETDTAATLAETGDHEGRGFVGELLHRLVVRMLPRPREDHDAGALLLRLFPDIAAATWLRELPPAWFERLAACIAPGEHERPWASLRNESVTALVLIATRVSAAGLEPRLWRLAPTVALQHSPFLRLSRAADASIADPAAALELQTTLAACRAEVEAIRRRLEDTGITVAIVHALESLRQGLDRTESLTAALTAPPESAAVHAQALLVQVVESLHERSSLRRLVVDDLRLLARRIVERHGSTGEHYIARDRADYFAMWRAALGGGLVTVATAAAKLQIPRIGLAPLPEGLLAGLNYSASFLFMLSMHFALATKQPAMTGARLAAIVSGTGGRQRLDSLADHVADTVRTQLAAALGNIIAVSAGAVALDLLLRALFRGTFIDVDKAHHVLHDLNPLTSGTVLFAAFTGVILWLSGLIGGWFENWAVAHRLPEAIAHHPLGARLGRARLQHFGHALGAHAAAWGGSVALGLLLGLTPTIGRIVGLPLDVRHVTLSTGTLAFAVSALSAQPLPWADIAWAMLGIAVIFVLNLSVSFLLALVLALRAHSVPMLEALRLARKVTGRFARDPWAFMGPPKG